MRILPADLRANPQPEWNTPESVSTALEDVIKTCDEKSSSLAYNRLLYAVGNNHAGTYFPIILAVMPCLESILRAGERWPQRTVIQILIDLFSSFVPEPGWETFNGVSLRATLRERIIPLKSYVIPLCKDDSVASKCAQDFLKCLNEGAA